MQSVSHQPEPYVDADRAANFLQLKRRQLLRLARVGELPAHPIGRGRRKSWRFRLSELSEAVDIKNSYVSGRNR
jgi:hypothetical protein